MIIFVNYLQRFSVSSELVSMFLLLYFMDVGRQVLEDSQFFLQKVWSVDCFHKPVICLR